VPAAALVAAAEPTIAAKGPQKGRQTAPSRARKARTPAAKARTGKIPGG